jgi:hypothetical protein
MIYHLFNYLKKLGWLSIKKRLEYHKSVLMYKCINNSAPDYLCNLFDMNTNSNVYSLRSSAKGNLFVPRPNSNFMKRTFHYSGTILWNSKLPPNLKLIQDIDLFKRKYTYYLMSTQHNEWLYSLYQGFILDYTKIVIFRCEYVCIVWNCICCIWLIWDRQPVWRTKSYNFNNTMICTSYYLLFWMNFVADLLWLFRSFYLLCAALPSGVS